MDSRYVQYLESFFALTSARVTPFDFLDISRLFGSIFDEMSLNERKRRAVL